MSCIFNIKYHISVDVKRENNTVMRLKTIISGAASVGQIG